MPRVCRTSPYVALRVHPLPQQSELLRVLGAVFVTYFRHVSFWASQRGQQLDRGCEFAGLDFLLSFSEALSENMKSYSSTVVVAVFVVR